MKARKVWNFLIGLFLFCWVLFAFVELFKDYDMESVGMGFFAGISFSLFIYYLSEGMRRFSK